MIANHHRKNYKHGYCGEESRLLLLGRPPSNAQAPTGGLAHAFECPGSPGRSTSPFPPPPGSYPHPPPRLTAPWAAPNGQSGGVTPFLTLMANWGGQVKMGKGPIWKFSENQICQSGPGVCDKAKIAGGGEGSQISLMGRSKKMVKSDVLKKVVHDMFERNGANGKLQEYETLVDSKRRPKMAGEKNGPNVRWLTTGENGAKKPGS